MSDVVTAPRPQGKTAAKKAETPASQTPGEATQPLSLVETLARDLYVHMIVAGQHRIRTTESLVEESLVQAEKFFEGIRRRRQEEN